MAMEGRKIYLPTALWKRLEWIAQENGEEYPETLRRLAVIAAGDEEERCLDLAKARGSMAVQAKVERKLDQREQAVLDQVDALHAAASALRDDPIAGGTDAVVAIAEKLGELLRD